MQAVVFAIHLIISLALVGVILLQRSEGGALGIGGGSNSMVSGRGAASLLTRTTGVLGVMFFVTSLWLAALAGLKKKNDILDINVPVSSAPAPSIPLSVPAAPAATQPVAPAIPTPTPDKSSNLNVAPKVNSATAAEPKPAPKPAAVKPAIPEPTAEIPAPAAPAGPSASGDDGAEAGGGSAGPQPR
jgi:preprotein translocase subunit SecG